MKQIYRVLPGYVFGAFNQYKAGDALELTEAEAIGFADKLILVGPALPTEGAKVPEGGFVTTGPKKTDDDEFDVDGATVDAVLAAVGEGKITAEAALIAEQQGKKRATLLAKLAELTKPVEDGQPKE